jgi:hypothetical protein
MSAKISYPSQIDKNSSWGIHLKFWFFEQYWWILVLAVSISVVALSLLKESVGTVATVVGALLSLIYFLQKQKLDELRLFRELFKEFNERYDAMNDDLARIASLEPGEMQMSDKAKIVDYLNLCGEEYLYFRKGYIDPQVWAAWHNGMKEIVSASSIQSVWQKEKISESYYGLPL